MRVIRVKGEGCNLVSGNNNLNEKAMERECHALICMADKPPSRLETPQL